MVARSGTTNFRLCPYPLSLIPKLIVCVHARIISSQPIDFGRMRQLNQKFISELLAKTESQ